MATLNTVLLTTTNNLAKNSNIVDSLLHSLESNKFFISLVGIIVFLTGRSLYNELYYYCSNDINFLDYHYVKKVTLWCVIFLYSRSIFHTTLMSILIILLFPPIFFTDVYMKKDDSKNKF